MMHRLAFRGGWTTFWLVGVVVFTATWSVQFADWADGLHILSFITLVGLLTGLALTRLERLPAPIAHLVALAVGTVVVFYQLTEFLGDALGGRRERIAYLWERWEEWYGAVSQGERADDLYLFILLMGALLWVLSYLSVWFVFRSRWIWLTLLLPGVILLLNLGYSDRVPTRLVLLYLFAGALLLMRFNFGQREAAWREARIPYPDTLLLRGMWTASYLALLVIFIGWMVPLSVQSQQVFAAWQEVNGPWKRVEQEFTRWFANLRGPGGSGVGGFAAFGEQFEVGGPLQLSDEPVLEVQASSPPYLVAHRYNVFDGRGWTSDIDRTFRDTSSASNRQVSPLVQFNADQEFPVPTTNSQARSSIVYGVHVLQPRGPMVFSTGEALKVDIPTNLRVAWHTYTDQKLDVQAATPEMVPPGLRPLVDLLKEAEFIPPPTPTPAPTPTAGDTESTPTPSPTPSPTPRPLAQMDPEDRTKIRAEQDRLAEQGIDTDFTINGPPYKITELTFSGPLPVYADVEAVYAQDGMRRGDSYTVEALVSEATPDELRSASTVYPTEIEDRYLQLHDSVTQRTRDLAQELAEGRGNPYDVAENIEGYLRSNMIYNESVNVPPRGVDVVDYFLFESGEGYCTYYASAMVELLRLNNIPSRVAVGFYPGSRDQTTNTYIYRDRNAHAWVEAFFPGYGWIPFEPTSARNPIQREQPDVTGTPASPGDASDGNQPADGRMNQLPMDEGPMGGGSGAAGTVEKPLGPVGWALRIGFVTILLMSAAIAVLWLRGMRFLTPQSRFFAKVQRAAHWGGVAVRPSMTPYEQAAVIAKEVPGTRPHVRYLADLYVRERYGHQPATEPELNRARRAWLNLRGLLFKRVLLGRWRSQGSGTDED